MNIKNIAVNALIPYENNPRRISKENLELLADIIKKFGFRVPCIIDINNVIVAGHARLEAAKILEMQEIPCVIADDLSPEEIKAFRLIDNKIAEKSNWDFDKLNLELEELNLNFDMNEFGFSVEIPEIENKEIDIEDFNEEEFEHECPRCGFKF